ncbi:MAG: hypothetical protein LUH03_08395 [Oscillospiraceae bacterium]|nr:hypothetical protein [Oscillospiraceae bacterium]
MSGKREQRQKKRHSKTPLIIVLILIVAVLITVAIWFRARSGTNETVESSENSQTAETAETNENTDGDETGEDEVEAETETESDAESALPEVQESSSLTLSSVYTSSILNPDCGGEYAEEIASLEVTNSSSNYLVSATLTATMSDGTEVNFAVYDLPAGATAEIFDTENQTLDSGVTCTALVCTSEEYIDEDVLMSDTIEVTVSGSDAIITNTGDSALTSLTVVYHCDMAGQYFGGTSYTITIDSLAAGESYTLSDSTLMGEVAVVRIYQ